MSAILFSSSVGPVAVDCLISERHDSSLGITETPIENGSKITDHAYLEPKRVTLDIANYNAAASYQALVRFQESRVPFTLVTGLYVYQNMLVRRISADRDAETANILRATADLQEAIIVQTAYTESSGDGGQAGGTKSTKAATPTKGIAKDSATADRATGTVQRGDAGSTTVDWGDRGSLFR